MPQRYFTVEEANRHVPRLEATFRRMLQIRTQLKTLYRRLDERGFAPRDEHFAPAVAGAHHDVVRDRGNFKGLLEVLRDELAAVRETGCVVKDVETGLVDWHSQSPDGRDILLCWRFGEKEVGWWHDAETGVAGRRPISELPTRRRGD